MCRSKREYSLNQDNTDAHNSVFLSLLHGRSDAGGQEPESKASSPLIDYVEKAPLPFCSVLFIQSKWIGSFAVHIVYTSHLFRESLLKTAAAWGNSRCSVHIAYCLCLFAWTILVLHGLIRISCFVYYDLMTWYNLKETISHGFTWIEQVFCIF